MQLVVKLQASWNLLFGQKIVSEVTTAIAEAMLIIVIPTSAPAGYAVSCFVGVTTGSTTGDGFGFGVGFTVSGSTGSG